jgi:hemolysin D
MRLDLVGLRFRAIWNMLGRYRRVFKRVWRERKTLDHKFHLAHEAAFMPAALELQETPVSPAPHVAMWLIMLFALLALIWSIFGKIDIIATAQGKIVPSDGTKVIQPIERAIVKAIYVRNGQVVKKGDVLIELDQTTASADVNRMSNEVVTMRLQSARARALLASLRSGQFPVIKRVPGIAEDRLEQEQRILDAQFGEHQAKLGRIEAQSVRQEAELKSAEAVIAKLEKTSSLARQRALDYKDLVDKNFMSQHGYLDKEQVRIEQEGELALQRSRLQELVATVQETRAQRASLVAETRRLALDSLNESEQKATAFDQELLKSVTRGRQMTLLAPVDGTVQQLAVHTVGGVVTEAQNLMMVVPNDNAVEVEDFLENKDIGFVRAGHASEVKIETFPFTKYGTIASHVKHVSHDAINDERRGLIYATRVVMDRSTLQVDGNTVNLTPGMAATVEIKTGQRRIIEYFLSPLLTYKDESLHER